MKKLGDLIVKAMEPQMMLFNLFDDWLKSLEDLKATEAPNCTYYVVII